MNPDEILKKVCRSIDILIETGGEYGGLFPSLLDLETHEMLKELPPAIEGQRMGDRAHPGSNLIHDQAVLKTMYALAVALDRPGYTDAADRYLKRFATHCTDTATGLFPWGEHGFWHLLEDRVGDSHQFHYPDRPNGTTYHDHLRQAPVWLWEKLYEFNPRCVERFAEGLDYHFKEGEPREYIRHAHIEQKSRLSRGPKSADFPRHGGFYILDWAFAYDKTVRADFLRQIEDMVNYWWPHRDPNGLLLIHTRQPEDNERQYNVNANGQTLSLGISLLEAADILEPRHPAIAALMRERADVYIRGFLSAPHDLDRGIFVYGSRRETDEIVTVSPVWGSIYGGCPASYLGLMCLCGYRLTRRAGLLRWAEAAGRCYVEMPLPENVAVPAMDAGMGLGLLADLYDITGDASWLKGGFELAEKLTAIYFDRDLPRGAAGIDWYESQMGPSFLQHGLARLALLARDRDNCPLDADYTGR